MIGIYWLSVMQTAHLHVADRHPHRADLVFPLDRREASRHRRFGQRITFDDSPARRLLETLFGFLQQRRRAGNAQLDRFQVRLPRFHLLVVQERLEEGRHAGHERGPCLPDRLHHIGDVARIGHQRDAAAPDDRDTLEAHRGKHVEERQAAQKAFVPIDQGALEPFADLHPGHDERLVAGEGCLRYAGGAAREEDQARIERIDGHLRPRRLRVLPDQLAELEIAGLQRDAVPLLLLLQQREQHHQHGRQIFANVGGDHPAHGSLGLHPLDLVIKEARQHDDCLGAASPTACSSSGSV